MRAFPDNSLTPQMGLVVLAVIAIMSGVAGRLMDQWPETGATYSPKDCNCVCQVEDEDGYVGTVSMSGPGAVGEALSALGVTDFPQEAAQVARIPCGSRLRITRNPPTLTIDKLPGASLVAMGKRININNAEQADLVAIPGIGPRLAARIVDERDLGGPFPAGYKLQGIQGLGTKKRRALELFTEAGPAGFPDRRQYERRGGRR